MLTSTLLSSRINIHYLRSLTATKRFISTTLHQIPTALYYATSPAFSIDCTDDWICSTILLRLWNPPFYSNFWPLLWFPFQLAGFCCLFWYKAWVTSRHQLGALLLLFSHSHFSSSVINFCEECRTFLKFLWHQRPLKSKYFKIYLLYRLFFLCDSVFPVVAPMFPGDGLLLERRMVVAIAERVTKSESWEGFISRLFELIEVWGDVGRRWVMGVRTRGFWLVGIVWVGVWRDVALTFVLLLSTHLINDNKRNHFITPYYKMS